MPKVRVLPHNGVLKTGAGKVLRAGSVVEVSKTDFDKLADNLAVVEEPKRKRRTKKGG